MNYVIKGINGKAIILVSFALAAILFAIFSSCNSKSRCANETGIDEISFNLIKIRDYDYYSEGVHYKVYLTNEGGIFVMNVTRDSLEIIKNKN